MTSLVFEAEPHADSVHCTETELIIHLADGRTLTVPLAWFPRLQAATPVQRQNFELLGQGQGIHWSDVDEDISVAGLLAGKGALPTQTQ